MILFIMMIFSIWRNLLISKLLIKSEKQTLTTSTQITVLLIGIGLIYVILLYMLGIFTGFYTSTVQLSIWSIWNYIIPYIVIIISAENIRKTLLKIYSFIQNVYKCEGEIKYHKVTIKA